MAIYVLPTANQGNWDAGTEVGVTGGIEQYLAGGVNDRAVSGTVLDVTQAPYSADNTGVADATSAINSAIAAASSGDVVYFPAGTYRVDAANGIDVAHTKSGITLRGAGSGSTVFDFRGSRGFVIGGAGAYTGPQTVSGTKTKGTAELTVPTPSSFIVGQFALVQVENEEDDTRIEAGAAPSFANNGASNVRSHTVKVTAVSGSTVTIDPPLLYDCTDYDVALSTHNLQTWHADEIGLEGLTIDGTNGSLITGLDWSFCQECWAYDVRSIKADNYPFQGHYNYRCQIQKCEAAERPGGGSNGAGILWNKCTSSLIIDNILRDVAPLTEENAGSINNVWAYNLCAERVTDSFLVNHGAHNLLNLYEGNVTPNYKSDGYFGSCSHNTFFRNWIHGSNETGSTSTFKAALNRFTRHFAHVGNVFGWDGVSNGEISYGNPNIGNGSADGFAGPTGLSDQEGETDFLQPGYGQDEYVIQASDIFAGDFWADWGKTGVVKTKVSATEAVITVSAVGHMEVGQGSDGIGSVVYWNSRSSSRPNLYITAINGLDITFEEAPINPGGGDDFPVAGTNVEIYSGLECYQERDLDVQVSTINVHNYTCDAAGTGAVTDSTVDTLPDSFAYSATPAFWTEDSFAGAFPPVDPDSPTFSLGIIPAGARYLASSSPPAAPTGLTLTAI